MPIRFNFKHHLGDPGWYLIHAWRRYELPTPSVSEIARWLNCSRRAVDEALRYDKPPSARIRKPNNPRAKEQMKARAKIIDKLLSVRSRKIGKLEQVKRDRIRVTVKVPFPNPAAVAREATRRNTPVGSVSTVRRLMKNLGYKPFATGRGPHLSVEYRKRRVKFCRETLPLQHLAKNFKFSDECTMDSNDRGTKRIWTKSKSLVPPRAFDVCPPTLRMWVCIGHGYRKLVLLKPGGCDSRQYVRRCLQVVAPDLVGSYLAQDGARFHTSEHTRKYLEKKGIHTLNWPPLSPDLNPAEHVFAYLKKMVGDSGAWGEKQLAAEVTKAFEEIPQAVIDNWCQGFWGCLRKCATGEGRLVR
jgi:transposase